VRCFLFDLANLSARGSDNRSYLALILVSSRNHEIKTQPTFITLKLGGRFFPLEITLDDDNARHDPIDPIWTPTLTG
jgi:hypothetical protein